MGILHLRGNVSQSAIHFLCPLRSVMISKTEASVWADPEYTVLAD